MLKILKANFRSLRREGGGNTVYTLHTPVLELLNDLTGKITGNSLVNFPVKVNRKSELTRIYLKVFSTGETINYSKRSDFATTAVKHRHNLLVLIRIHSQL